MPDTDANRLRRIDAVVKQAEIKFALGRHAEHVQALEAIRDLVEAVADRSAARRVVVLDRIPPQPDRRSPRVSIAYCREALAIATASGLEEIRAFAECCLTHVYSVSGDLREGMVTGERALAMFEARGNVWWAAARYGGSSGGKRIWANGRRASTYCRRALEHGRDVNDLRLKVVGWWRTGSTHRCSGGIRSRVSDAARRRWRWRPSPSTRRWRGPSKASRSRRLAR